MKTKYWIALLACIMLFPGIVGVFLLLPGEGVTHAQITSDGQVLRIVDLGIDQVFTVTSPSGGTNTVTVKDGKIAVTEASCPDHYCMARGYCQGGAQIVCLPNKLVISFLENQEVDGVVG